ncbi:hypothetical protein V6N11_058977 [Hibiscus sabdariffa]|uniref:Uncharacterized protein n=1 Tax=Hibiscus sabdariffa TaxID=183260 RepID=A0ABR2U5T2_9ROSI
MFDPDILENIRVDRSHDSSDIVFVGRFGRPPEVVDGLVLPMGSENMLVPTPNPSAPRFVVVVVQDAEESLGSARVVDMIVESEAEKNARDFAPSGLDDSTLNLNSKAGSVHGNHTKLSFRDMVLGLQSNENEIQDILELDVVICDGDGKRSSLECVTFCMGLGMFVDFRIEEKNRFDVGNPEKIIAKKKSSSLLESTFSKESDHDSEKCVTEQILKFNDQLNLRKGSGSKTKKTEGIRAVKNENELVMSKGFRTVNKENESIMPIGVGSVASTGMVVSAPTTLDLIKNSTVKVEDDAKGNMDSLESGKCTILVTS